LRGQCTQHRLPLTRAVGDRRLPHHHSLGGLRQHPTGRDISALTLLRGAHLIGPLTALPVAVLPSPARSPLVTDCLPAPLARALRHVFRDPLHAASGYDEPSLTIRCSADFTRSARCVMDLEGSKSARRV